MTPHSYLRRGILPALVLAGSVSAPGLLLANIVRTVTNVNLTNNTSASIAQIQFDLTSKGIGTLFQMDKDNVAFGTPTAGPNKGPQRFDLNVAFVGMDQVRVTLSALKLFAPGEQVVFQGILPGTRQVRISRVSWSNDKGQVLRPLPSLPGFQVVMNDLQYSPFNDTDDPFGIQNLLFMTDISPEAFDALDLDAIFSEPRNLSLPAFLLSAGSSTDFPGLGDPLPGDFFAALGQIVDTSGNVVGSFIQGVELAPEPRSLTLLILGLCGAAAIISRYRMSRISGSRYRRPSWLP